MRLVHAAVAAALLLASSASAQGIGDAAAREKDKRKASTAKPAKVYTEGDIGRSMTPASATPDLPASPADAAAKPAGEGGATAEGGAAAAGTPEDPEKAAQEARAKAETEWRTKLEEARKEEAAYQEGVNRAQLLLNDTSNLYNAGRAATAQALEEHQKKLVEVRARIAALEEEGRRNNYR